MQNLQFKQLMQEEITTDKKTIIIETAEKLFATNGYDATSIRDIAKAGSFNSSMISYYFGSKEKLMEGILIYRTTSLENVFGPLLSSGRSPLEKLYILNNFYVEKIFQHKYFYLLIFQIQSLSDKYKLIKTFYDETRYKNFNILDKIIKDGQALQNFREDIDTSFLLFVLSGTMNNVMVNKDYYREVNQIGDMPEEDFNNLLKERAKKFLTERIEEIVIFRPSSL